MAHTPLASLIQKIYTAASTETEQQNNNLVKEELEREPRVIIIGAGLAGLTCAYRLKQVGILATIYEATDRVGGRCWTRRRAFKDNQVIERGGEFLNTSHTEILNLVKEFQLQLDNVIAAEVDGTKPLYYFNGAPYTVEEATNDFLEIFPQLQKDLEEVGETTLYTHYTKRGYELDHLSIIDYLNEIVPGGSRSRLGQLLTLAYTIEYGAEPDTQSALNLLYLLGYAPNGPLQLFGDSDESFHIKGGNDQLPQLIAKELDGQIHFRSELIKIEQMNSGEIRLYFRNKESSWEVIADKVVLTIPFSILKLIDYENAGFSPLKQAAIEEIGMGDNAKLHVQFQSRFWSKQGYNGATFADTGYQHTWDASRAQQGETGILVNYTGAKTINEAQLKDTTETFLTQLEPVFPEAKKQWNGQSTLDHWLTNQWTRGSYSYYKIGQYTKFAGVQKEREGNIFFAGEHTSIDYQGYLNGAVESGERAAQEILGDL